MALTRNPTCPAFAANTFTREAPGGGEGPPLTNVVLTDAHLHALRTLTNDDTSGEAAFSPSGQRLAYTSGRGYENQTETGRTGSRVYVMNVDGTHDRVLTDGFDEVPAWAPDGSALAYVRRTSPNQLWRVDLRSGRQKMLATTPDIQGRPQWLPDGRIVYWTPSGVRAVPQSGGQPSLVVALTNRRVVFSPDGGKYAVAPSTQGLPINVVDVATGHVVKVPKSGTAIAEVVAWTTDNHVIFSQNVRGPGINLVSWRPGTAKPRLLSQDYGVLDGLAENPACAP